MDISGATLSDKAGKWPSVTKCTPVALLTGLMADHSRYSGLSLQATNIKPRTGIFLDSDREPTSDYSPSRDTKGILPIVLDNGSGLLDPPDCGGSHGRRGLAAEHAGRRAAARSRTTLVQQHKSINQRHRQSQTEKGWRKSGRSTPTCSERQRPISRHSEKHGEQEADRTYSTAQLKDLARGRGCRQRSLFFIKQRPAKLQ
jgi:hypothetical protein